MANYNKPLNCKAYGSIPHISSSKLGIGDNRLTIGQENILFKKTRSKYDNIVVTEKLDGSNVAVAKVDGILYPLTRAGNICSQSKFTQHLDFNQYLYNNYNKFDSILEEGEQLSGEWLSSTHGILYDLRNRDPFVVFDMFTKKNSKNIRERYLFSYTIETISKKFTHVPLLYSDNSSADLNEIHKKLGQYGHYNSMEFTEGFVLKCENLKKENCEFMAKYVKPEITQGKYLKSRYNLQLNIQNFGYTISDYDRYIITYNGIFNSLGIDLIKLIDKYKSRTKQ